MLGNQQLYDSMIITHPNGVNHAVDMILPHKDVYSKFWHIPWQFVGICHYRECSCNFSQHLANGDSLKAKTHNEPKGIIPSVDPPYTWLEAALYVMFTLKKLDKILIWDTNTILYQLEKYNGFGYNLYHPEINSPYVWSGTNHYTKGKYASDGKFDPNLVDQQMGGAAIYQTLLSRDI